MSERKRLHKSDYDLCTKKLDLDPARRSILVASLMEAKGYMDMYQARIYDHIIRRASDPAADRILLNGAELSVVKCALGNFEIRHLQLNKENRNTLEDMLRQLSMKRRDYQCYQTMQAICAGTN